MSQSNPPNSKTKGLLLSVFCVAILSTGAFFLVRQKAAKQYEGQFAAVKNDPQEDVALNQERIVLAKGIREKWKPWALQHKDLLRKMRQGNPQDASIALEVFTKLPVKFAGPEAVVTFDDLTNGQARFTWQALENNLVRPGAPISRDAQFRKKAVADDFLKEHDVLLSSSVNSGKSHINVWASGRITETTVVKNPRVSGQPVYGDPVSKEITPSYDLF